MRFDPYEIWATIIVGVNVLTLGFMVSVGVRLMWSAYHSIPKRRKVTLFLLPLLFLGYLWYVANGVKPAIVALTDNIDATAAERASLIRTALAAGINVCIANMLDYLAHSRQKGSPRP